MKKRFLAAMLVFVIVFSSFSGFSLVEAENTLTEEKMTEVRTTQQTQDASQKKSDKQIMAEVISQTRCDHITGIEPIIPLHVRSTLS